MLETRIGRTVGVCCLLAVLFGLTVGFGTLAPAPALGSYPDSATLAQEYDATIGQRVQVSGTVVRTEPLVLAAEYDYYAAGAANSGSLDLTITAVERPVRVGQSVQVFGTLRPDRTIEAREIVVVPARNVAYMYAVSALAGLWVLARLLRGWAVDWRTGAVTRRDRPRSLAAVIREHRQEGRE